MSLQSGSKKLHIAMFPWFALGHMTPFLHLSNELAKRGNKISLLLPRKAQLQLQHMNLHPHLVTFHVVSVPQVNCLPPGTETASEIPINLVPHLVTAMDLTRDQVKALLDKLRPEFVFYDFMHWIPDLAVEIGFKTVCYNTVSAASSAIAFVPGRKLLKDRKLSEDELLETPIGYPSAKVVLRKCEAHALAFIFEEFAMGVTFYERITTAMKHCDMLAIRTCRELEGNLCDYIAKEYKKPMILTGPVLPAPSKVPLEGQYADWLSNFDPQMVIFCAFGSQWILEKDQFQELLLGLELTGLPFLVALRPPHGTISIEEALPEGFQDRIIRRGMICNNVVPQPAILSHQSVGCFVSHCGFGSMWESLMSHCQIVLVPFLGDQILNTRQLAEELQVGIEVERDENGKFSKESLCKAVRSAMDKESEVGNLIRENHAKWKETISKPGFMSGYIDEFIQSLHQL